MVDDIVTIFGLRGGREVYLDVPDWYFQSSGNFSIRTPHSTHVVYNKSENSHRPFTKDFLIQHYLEPTVSSEEGQLPLNRLSIKPFGEESERFEVVVTEEIMELYCDDYPPVTIVESK